MAPAHDHVLGFFILLSLSQRALQMDQNQDENLPDIAFRPYPGVGAIIWTPFLLYLIVLSAIDGKLTALLITQGLLLLLIYFYSDSYKITEEHISIKRIWTKPRLIPRSSIVRIGYKSQGNGDRGVFVKYRKQNGKTRSILLPTNVHFDRRERILRKLAYSNLDQFDRGLRERFLKAQTEHPPIGT